MILINFKLYKEIFGEGAVKLARIAREVADEHKIRIVVTVPALEAVKVKEETGAEVWLQHIDEYEEGKYTGWISAVEAMKYGINGSLINHSEHKLAKGTVQKIIANKPEGFEIACCVHSLGQINEWAAASGPEWILYEPPELIASSDKSVATEKPDAIKKAAELCLEKRGFDESNPYEKQEFNKLLVGAGVKAREDVEVSLKMGAWGVGLASAFVLGKDPKAVLEELARGFKN